MVFDIDGNGTAGAFSDGVLILRYLIALRGLALIGGAVALDALRETAADIEAYLGQVIDQFDIDDNGTVGAFSDGILIARFLTGLRGGGLIDGAVAADGNRTTAEEIVAYLEELATSTLGFVDPEEVRTIEENNDLDLELAFDRASDLNRYTQEELDAAEKWVITTASTQVPDELITSLDVDDLRVVESIPNTFILELSSDSQTTDAVVGQLDSPGIEFYPLVPIEAVLDYTPNDPLFANQWHLRNIGQTGGTAGIDANITSAWDIRVPGNSSRTVRGRDVVIGIVDDALEWEHPDIGNRYRSDLSNDFKDNDPNPSPNSPNENHGTAVAGVAAASGDNGIGVTGAAPSAFIAGLRLVGGATDDRVADALSWENQEIDIYQNSWSPTNKLALKAVDPLTLRAMQNGVKNGRRGKGNIYVFSAGNNRRPSVFNPLGADNVNYNGYANSRYTIAVGAINHNGVHAPYSEPGAPLLISAPAGNGGVGVTTTGLVGAGSIENDYRDDFTGTSAAAPLVSGVIALMLEANPELSWRDVQHIIVETAVQNDPSHPDWVINGAGFPVNHLYGFGAIDAEAAVSAAIDWMLVDPEVIIAEEFILSGGVRIPDNNPGGVERTVTFNSNIEVEWAEVVFQATHPRRGDLEVVLISPDGTESILAEQRPDNNADYDNWIFTSARHWGESSVGEWTLRVSDLSSGQTGTLDSAELRLIGTVDEVVASPNQAPNQAPTAVNDTASTQENNLSFILGNSSVNIAVLANDFDVDDDPISITGVGTPNNGSASIRENQIIYTPAFQFTGTDSFTYSISDGNGGTDSATVTVTVERANLRPFASDDFAVTQENSSVNISVLANDIDGDDDLISITGVQTPNNGSVSIEENQIIYTPAVNFTGTDSFTYSISDGNGGTDSATVILEVGIPNAAPIASDDFASTTEGSSVLIDVLDNDVDPDGHQLSIQDIRSNTASGGSVSLLNNEVRYRPAFFDFVGIESFDYTISDGRGGTDSATVTVTVEPGNSAPFAINDSASTDQNRSVNIFVLDNDFGDAISIQGISSITASGASVSINGNALLYNPAFGFTGTDIFVYTISDGRDTSTAAVSVTVESAGDAGESLGSISGVNFFDADADGVRDAGEQGLAGWTIFFDTNNNGVQDNNEASVVTGANGAYSFGGLLAGIYNVRAIQQPGFAQTTFNPIVITLAAGQDRVGVNFGNVSFSSSVRANFDVRTADILTGTPGIGDTFSLSSSQAVTIEGFEDGLDVLQVGGGLTFSDLDVTAGTGSSIGNTLIAIESSSQIIAELIGVQPVVITEDDFTFIE